MTATYSRKTGSFEATMKQIEYLRDLIRRKTDMDPGVIEVWAANGLLNAQFVSEMIDEYKIMPDRADTILRVEPGYYSLRNGGATDLYIVVSTKDGERTYAKRLQQVGNTWKWVYEKGAVASLSKLTPLSAEEAGEWGRLHGRCLHCFRALTVPESVKRGYGPTCAKHLEKNK